jgi:hypothetical protein
LSKTAELRGRPLIGAVLHCDNFVEKDKNGRVVLDINMVADINVPISVYERRHKGRESVTEFWNFKETVQHEVRAVC